jgi:hypothetical protein
MPMAGAPATSGPATIILNGDNPATVILIFKFVPVIVARVQFAVQQISQSVRHSFSISVRLPFGVDEPTN